MCKWKAFGFDVEGGGGALYVALPFIGDLWVEANAVVRGRSWADYMVSETSLHLYLGRRHLVICPAILRGFSVSFGTA